MPCPESSRRSPERHSVLLIDADSLVYACGFTTEGEPVRNCLYLLDKSIEGIMKAVPAEFTRVFLTGSKADGPVNFREVITDDYKANRVAAKPEHYLAAREHLTVMWGAEIITGMEADDAVSIAQTEDTCIASIDKDLRQVPGWHYSWKKPEQGVVYVTEEQGLHWFYTQMLTGDAVDNIKGLPRCTEEVVEHYGLSRHALRGCGARTARTVLHGCTPLDCYTNVKHCYDSLVQEGGITEEYMKLQADLLWMVRELDQEGEPVLWTPPEEIT